jgi:hypothetical protein
MIRNAILVSAGIVVAVVLGSLLAPSPPPIGAAAAAAAPPCNFAASLPVTSFEPTAPNQDPPASATQASAAIKSDLLAAFNLAPAFFQQQLCGLAGVYITTGVDSWGYRNITSPKPYRRYIALTANLWAGPRQAAIPLNAYENRVFGPPLSWNTVDPSPPTYLAATPNSGQMTILAALAHEFGHVLWADLLIDTPGTNPDSRRFCAKELDNSWKGGPLPTPWTTFEDTDPNGADIADDPSDPPDAGDPSLTDIHVLRLAAALKAQPPQLDRAHRILRRLLSRSRPYPSFLGAFSANEHFVETFTLYTLMHARPPLTSAPLLVASGKTVDIPADLLAPGDKPRTRLLRLLKCLQDLYPT